MGLGLEPYGGPRGVGVSDDQGAPATISSLFACVGVTCPYWMSGGVSCNSTPRLALGGGEYIAGVLVVMDSGCSSM